MKCQQCGEKEATSFYKETINGQTRTFHLCEDCMKKLHSESPMMHLWGGSGDFGTLWKEMLGLQEPGDRIRQTARQCPDCGMSETALRSGGLAGCPGCYRAFSDILLPYIKKVHGVDSHISSLPAGVEPQRKSPAAELREKLRQAIEREEYEEAARIRDELRRLEAE